jgi:perosamine synthetase
MTIQSSFPFFDEESVNKILVDVRAALKSGVLTGGPHTKKFERKFAEYVGAKHAIAVNSGTSNLEIALRYFGVKDREVIVPTNTFIATPNSVVFAGGKPVFADIREDTLCIDPQDVERRITPQTAGLVVVHLAGLVCPQIDQLIKICRDYNLFLLEDCAHAHGAMVGNYMAGTLGDAGCFSFYPTKIMTTGEGGMLVTNDTGLADAALIMRNHGQDSQRLMVTLGHNWCMSEVSAILGEYQLEKLESFVHRRNEIARIYETSLEKVEGVTLFKTPSNMRNSYYKYPIKLSDNIDTQRLVEILKEKFNVETGSLYYPPCHLHPYYQTNFGTREGDLPVAEKVLGKVLCLPIHLGLTDEQVLQVTNALIRSIKVLN